MHTSQSIIFLLFLQTSFLFGQNRVQSFVQQHALSIPTINPDDENYRDLVTIGNAIGDAQIVMLGEQDHGDAATYFAKTRLIKYLHEKKGFDVLAFESDFFGLNEGWTHLEKSKPVIDTFLQNNIMSLWAYCSSCFPLLHNYIPATQRTVSPLDLSGFDNQMTYTYSRYHLVEKLDSVLRQADIPITKQANYQLEVIPLLETLVTKFGHQRPSNDFFSECGKALQIIKAQWKSKAAGTDFWSLLIDNLIAFNEEESNLKNDRWKAESIRDKQMYLNLKWLLQAKYANKKVIIWAANNHVARYTNNNKYISMGQYLSSDTSLSDRIYSIAFTSYEGEGGRLWDKTFTISKPKSNSFESWINNSFQYAFVDFTAYNKIFPQSKEEFNMRGWRYWTFKKQWNKVFDGIFYIKTMYSCND